MRVVGALRGEFPLADLLDYVGLARSTYYYRVSHPHVDRLADVRGLVRSVFEGSGGAYGYRRVAMALECFCQSLSFICGTVVFQPWQ